MQSTSHFCVTKPTLGEVKTGFTVGNYIHVPYRCHLKLNRNARILFSPFIPSTEGFRDTWTQESHEPSHYKALSSSPARASHRTETTNQLLSNLILPYTLIRLKEEKEIFLCSCPHSLASSLVWCTPGSPSTTLIISLKREHK